MDYVLISLILGLIALSFPILNIIQSSRIGKKRILFFPILSFTFSMLSIISHIVMYNNILGQGKVGDTFDLIGGTLFGSVALLFMTFILNVLSTSINLKHLKN